MIEPSEIQIEAIDADRELEKSLQPRDGSSVELFQASIEKNVLKIAAYRVLLLLSAQEEINNLKAENKQLRETLGISP